MGTLRAWGWSACAACLLWLGTTTLHAQPAPKGKPEPVSGCVQVRTEASFNGYGYDHWVHLKNACKRAQTCSVKTNVNPEPMSAEVAVGEDKSVLTFMGSPAREFNAEVSCHDRG